MFYVNAKIIYLQNAKGTQLIWDEENPIPNYPSRMQFSQAENGLPLKQSLAVAKQPSKTR